MVGGSSPLGLATESPEALLPGFFHALEYLFVADKYKQQRQSCYANFTPNSDTGIETMKRILVIIFVTSTMMFSGCNDSIQQSTETEQHSDSSSDLDSSSADVHEETSANDSSNIEYGDKFPKVLAVEASYVKNENWRFRVTLSSSYDTPERYADAWRILDEDDNELGIRILGHDHANEQPFTRSGAIQLPADSKTVFVEGRDQANGWSGQRFKFNLPNVDLPAAEKSTE